MGKDRQLMSPSSLSDQASESIVDGYGCNDEIRTALRTSSPTLEEDGCLSFVSHFTRIRSHSLRAQVLLNLIPSHCTFLHSFIILLVSRIYTIHIE